MAKYWFEEITSLNRAFLLLEKVNPEYREIIAQQAIDFVKGVRLRTPTDRNMGYARIQEMQAVKQADRWFVQDPAALKVLNDCYYVDDTVRHTVGVRLLLCIQAIDNFLQSDGADLDDRYRRISVYKLIKEVFDKDMDVFQQQGQKRKRRKAC